MPYDIRDRNNIGEISVNHPNHICVVADMSSSTWNTVGSHEVFTVTGLVRMLWWVFCTQSLTTASGYAFFDFRLEPSGTGDVVGPYSVGHDSLTAGKFGSLANNSFLTGSASGTGVLVPGITDIMSYGLDIGYDLTNAALTGGTLEFHCVWQPLSAGATVVAGAGGSL